MMDFAPNESARNIANMTALWFGVTLMWLTAAVFLAVFWPSEKPFFELTLNELGDYLSGVVSPVAFVWLILGYSQQGHELRSSIITFKEQSEELRKSAQQAEIQANALVEQMHYAELNSFHALAQLMIQEVVFSAARVSALLYDDKHMQAFWGQFGHGDRDVFFRALNRIMVRGRHAIMIDKLDKFMNGDEYALAYCSQVERLLDAARKVDKDNVLVDLYLNSELGMCYRILCRVLNRASSYDAVSSVEGV